MNSRIAACLLMFLPIAAFAQAPSDNRFTEEAAYTAQILSTEPLMVRYALTGTSRFGATELTERLDGQSTLVYAYQGAEVMIHSTGLVIDDESAYTFGYQNYVNPDPHHPVVSVTAYPDADQHAFRYLRDITGRHPLNASFVVTFQPGAVYAPEAVHLQAVYFSLKPTAAPFIDVFAGAALAKSNPVPTGTASPYRLYFNQHAHSSGAGPGGLREDDHAFSCRTGYAMKARHTTIVSLFPLRVATNYFCGQLESSSRHSVDTRNPRWSDWMSAFDGTWFTCPYHRVMIGRERRNTSMRYQCADIHVGGERHLMPSVDVWSDGLVEISHAYACEGQDYIGGRWVNVMAMTGQRSSNGGSTQYRCSKL